MIDKDFNSIIELFEAFPNEQSCIDHLEWLRWKGDVVSPFDPTSKVYKCKDNKFRCKNTGKYFNVKTNTLFDSSKIELRKWFVAIWLVTSHKKGISSAQLSRDIDVTQKTAWFMLQRIRNCFGISNDIEEDVNNGNGNKLDGAVEIDETFVGGKNKFRHRDKKIKACQGRSFKDKVPVFGMLQRGGKVIAKVVPNTRSITLFPLILKYIRVGSQLYTDEWDYSDAVNYLYNHRNVNHGAGFYGYDEITTNRIENFWTVVKRSILGIYYHWSRKHIQRYIDECVYRFNTRHHSDGERFNLLLENTEHRLTYKELIYG